MNGAGRGCEDLMHPDDVLAVRNLRVAFRQHNVSVPAVQDVSFRIARGETLALVGESGSGKSVTSLGILGLLPTARTCEAQGEVWLRRKSGLVIDLLTQSEHEMRQIRGGEAAMIFQEPMTSFNPVKTIGMQIAEAVRCHGNLGRRAARSHAAELLGLVGIADPVKRLDDYPHEMSGGMRQRAMIAMAISCEPSLLIADEPTTALDVTVQAQILALLRRIQEQSAMAMIFITHNLGVVGEIADRVMVMYSGRVVEEAPTRSLFVKPRMPYTAGLLRSVPRLEDLGAGVPGELPAIPGNVPDPLSPPPGCAFAPRCDFRVAGQCDTAMPAMASCEAGHHVRCVRWHEIEAGLQGGVA